MTEGQMQDGEMDAVENENRQQEEDGQVAQTNYVVHLNREWDLLGWPRTGGEKVDGRDGDNEGQSMVYDDVVELLEVFHRQGHSGSSAPYVMRLFSRVAMFKPLSPLTGEDDEWNEISRNELAIEYQNKRKSSVFKQLKDDGTVFVYDIDAVVSPESITFPYTPITRTVFVEEEGNDVHPR